MAHAMMPRAAAQNELLRKIVLAATTVGGVTVFVKLIAIAKEAAVARGFGRDIAIDAYVLAFTPITMVVGTTAASIQAAYVPPWSPRGPAVPSRSSARSRMR